MTKKFLVLGVILLGGVFILSGCGKSVADRTTEGVIEKATGAKVDIDSDASRIKYEMDGVKVETGEKTALPENFSKDVYLISDKINSVISKPEEKYYSVYLETTVVPKEASDKYNTELKAQGWTIKSSQIMGGFYAIQAEKDVRNLAITIYRLPEPDDGKTIVALTETPKE